MVQLLKMLFVNAEDVVSSVSGVIGSHIQLSAETQLSAKVSWWRRDVTLRQGQACSWRSKQSPEVIERGDALASLIMYNMRVSFCVNVKREDAFFLRNIDFARTRHRVGTVGEADDLAGSLEKKAQRGAVLAPFERGIGVALGLRFR